MVSLIKKWRLMFPRFREIVHDEGIKKALVCTKNLLTPIVLSPYENAYWAFLKSKSTDDLLIREIHGNKMYLSFSDRGLSKDLILRGTREELQVEVLKEEVKKGMNILDIGANLGYYALLEASLVGSTGKVYAIEPAPKNFEILNKNVKLNNYESIVTTYNLAISDKGGTGLLYLSEKSNLNRLGSSDGRNLSYLKLNKGQIEVETTTVDKFLEDKSPINFLRMDIEGYELMALKGMKRTLEKAESPFKLFFEVHHFLYDNPKQTIRKIFHDLDKLGFKLKVIVDRYTIVRDVPLTDAPNVICERRWAPSVLFEK